MNTKIILTAGKLYAIGILILAFIAVFKGMNEVAIIAVATGAGLYGWRKHENRKIKENDKTHNLDYKKKINY